MSTKNVESMFGSEATDTEVENVDIYLEDEVVAISLLTCFCMVSQRCIFNAKVFERLS